MRSMPSHACIEYTDTPLPSNKASDVMKAQEQVCVKRLFDSKFMISKADEGELDDYMCDK